MNCEPKVKNWRFLKANKFEYQTNLKDFYFPWVGHIYFAYDLIFNLNPRRVVELGTYKGTSFFSFCQSIKNNSLKTRVDAIDSWEGDKHAGFYGDKVLEQVSEISSKFYSSVDYHLVRKLFKDALPDYTDGSIDLLHIDGLHTYKAVREDFESWFPKVKDDGVILFHDTTAKNKDFGVWKFWEEVRTNFKDYYFINFEHSSGLGVMSKNEIFSFSNDTTISREFTDYYKIQGSVPITEALRNYVEELLGRFEKQSKDYESKAKEFNQADKYVHELLERISFLEAQLEASSKQVKSINEHVELLDSQLKHYLEIKNRRSFKLLQKVLTVVGREL